MNVYANIHIFIFLFLYLILCIYLFGCTRSYQWHMVSLVMAYVVFSSLTKD